MSYKRRIVCDLDDTISKTINRDFIGAEPIQPVIDKINYLYEQGWEIIINTARGQLSCEGDYLKADQKYRPQIEEWLKQHDVKYHELTFNKVLAAYYIDDKALTPEAFVNLNIQVLKSGWSGALVELRGDRVYKTHKNSLNEAMWYLQFQQSKINTVSIPKVYSLIGETICLQYIEGETPIEHELLHENIMDVVDSFRHTYMDAPCFSTYVERMAGHFSYHGKYWDLLPILESKIELFNQYKSFCHGDFSLENIIDSDDVWYLIDPIYDTNMYSSWLLDLSKMLHSLRKNGYSSNYVELSNYYQKHFKDLTLHDILLLEITQWIRTLKYISDVKKREQFEAIINDLIYSYVFGN